MVQETVRRAPTHARAHGQVRLQMGTWEGLDGVGWGGGGVGMGMGMGVETGMGMGLGAYTDTNMRYPSVREGACASASGHARATSSAMPSA